MTGNDFVAMFGDLIRGILREELQAVMHPADGWRDQRQSPLGPRRHCCAVRRRLAHNEPGARIVGDRYLLSGEAIEYELERIGRPKAGVRKTAATATLTPEDEALARLSLRLLKTPKHS